MEGLLHSHLDTLEMFQVRTALRNIKQDVPHWLEILPIGPILTLNQFKILGQRLRMTFFFFMAIVLTLHICLIWLSISERRLIGRFP